MPECISLRTDIAVSSCTCVHCLCRSPEGCLPGVKILESTYHVKDFFQLIGKITNYCFNCKVELSSKSQETE